MRFWSALTWQHFDSFAISLNLLRRIYFITKRRQGARTKVLTGNCPTKDARQPCKISRWFLSFNYRNWAINLESPLVQRNMKTKTFVITLAFLLTACSLIWSPTATVKKFMAAAQKGDADAMTQLFSKKARQKTGVDTIQSNNQQFSEMVKRANVVDGQYRMESIQETSTPEGRRVSFVYENDKATDVLRLVFDLSKEGSAWKIDNIGSGDSEDVDASVSPTAPSPLIIKPPPSSPSPVNENDKTRPPISFGVLNSKATSLPTPPYPPIAKAAKASGTVVVQVTVDENGNVISARAVSGHPLLQAAAVVAARSAKFSPTRLSGQPVKVSGVITYNFAPQ